MRKDEQVLLLALLAVLFGPASSLDKFEDDEIDDDCHVKTSIVLRKLDTCDSQKIKDDFRRNQLWTDVVKETIDEMKQLREDIKSQSDQLANKLENKLEGVIKQAHDDKLEMKASMDRTLQSVEANKKQMEDLVKQGQSITDCLRTLASWPPIERNARLFFKAMGRTFYYNRTSVTWYESRDWCSSRGMQLATLKTAEEMKQVPNTLGDKTSTRGNAFWVSASDIGRSAGQFHWADGTPVLESTWHSGQPDQYKANQETCTLIHTGYEKLWDYRCSATWSTLCEVPELLATCL